MKAALLLSTVFLLSSAAYAQMRVIYPEGIKANEAPLPTFPAEAKNPIYGEEVKVLMDIDASGKVKAALVYGPMVPCSNLSDPVAVPVMRAAHAAAMATVFEPVLKDGKPAQERVSIGYRLRPRISPPPEEERKIVSIGIANGRTKALSRPEYPEALRASGLRGSISVSILIDETGKVISAGSFSGRSEFAAAGVKAACGAVFAPMTLKNEPAKMFGTLMFNFAP